MRVLVTGAKGFIGKAVCHNLSQKNCDVIALDVLADRNVKTGNISRIQGDLSDADSLTEAIAGLSVDCCIHLAWVGIPELSYQNSKQSLMMGLNLLEVCQKTRVKHIIMAGSCSEYKNPHGMIDESWPINAEGAFQTSKIGLMGLAERFCRENEILFHWTRFFYVLGVGQRSGSLVPHILRSLKEGDLPALKTSHNENDFIDARDVAEAIASLVMSRPNSQVFNIGSGVATPVWRLAESARKSMNITREIPYPDHGDRVCFHADIGRLTRATGWVPKIALEQTIQDMAHWIDS